MLACLLATANSSIVPWAAAAEFVSGGGFTIQNANYIAGFSPDGGKAAPAAFIGDAYVWVGIIDW